MYRSAILHSEKVDSKTKIIHPLVDLKDLQPFLRSGETCVSTLTQQTPRLRVKVVAVPLELGMFLRLEAR